MSSQRAAYHHVRMADASLLSAKEKTIAMEKQEEELKFAEMETRLRKLIVDIMGPSIKEFANFGTELEATGARLNEQTEHLQRVAAEMNLVRERNDQVLEFESTLEEFRSQVNHMEAKMAETDTENKRRQEHVEQLCEAERTKSTRLGRSLDRAMQDVDQLDNTQKELATNLHAGLTRHRSELEGEIRRVSSHVQEVQSMHAKFADQVWGTEDEDESAPPSLRRFDMQHRRLREEMTDAMTNIGELQLLQPRMDAAESKQSDTAGKLQAASDVLHQVKSRTEKIERESKHDVKKISNMTAALTANMLQELRKSLSDELGEVREKLKNLETDVQKWQVGFSPYEEALQSTSKYLEASLREVRIDLEGVDTKRRKDKMAADELLQSMETRVSTACDDSQGALRVLEHLSHVISMSLQSQRMSVALDLQDFVDRKDAPYVGVHGIAPKPGLARSDGLQKAAKAIHPDQLFRLGYQPQPITFQGTSFERPKLLALCEQLVHVAQEVLQQGPQRQGSSRAQPRVLLGEHMPDGQQPPPSVLVPQATGVTAELPAAGAGGVGKTAARWGERQATPASIVARPGSRQLLVRGSTPENEACTPADRGQRGTSRGAHEELPLRPESIVEDAPGLKAARLPALAGAVVAGGRERTFGMEVQRPLTVR